MSEQEAHVVTPAARPVRLEETKVSPRHSRANTGYVQSRIWGDEVTATLSTLYTKKGLGVL